MNANGYAGAPAWITEMGSYRENTYNGQSTDNNIIVAWWIQASEPGSNYVNGVELFSLYDWGSGYTSGAIHGSYPSAETYTPGYYAMRIAARALVGARPTYPGNQQRQKRLVGGHQRLVGTLLPHRMQ
jgi:hypothetical protein